MAAISCLAGPGVPLRGLMPSGPVRPVRPCLVRPRTGPVAANSVWPLGPVRPCLVKPLGLCPTAGLWRLKSGSGSAGAPSGPILAPYGGMVSFYLQPKPREQKSLSCIDLG